MWSESERVGGVFVKNYKDLEYISNFIISILFLIHHNCILSRLFSRAKPVSGAASNISER